MNRTKMKVELGINDTSSGDVLRFVNNGLIVTLDTCERAFLHIGNLCGTNVDERCDRLSRLKIGSTMRVKVTSAYRGSRGRRIEVRELSSAT